MTIICEALDDFVFVDYLAVNRRQKVLLLGNEALACSCVEAAISTLAVPDFLQMRPDALLEHLEAVFGVLRVKL